METEEVRLRMPPDVKAWLSAVAEVEGRSLNKQAVYLLKAAMSADQAKKETNQ